MTKPFLYIFFLALAFFLVSCGQTANKNQYKTQPENLSELHAGFLEDELTPDTYSKKDTPLIVVTTGHTYPLLRHPIAFKSFVKTIKDQNPDFVFILGDMVFDNTQEEWDSFFGYFKGLENKMYFAPGNHDLNFHYERYNGIRDNQFIAEKRYIDNIGYRYKILSGETANFVFINMNDSLSRISKYLKETKLLLGNSKTNFFLSSQSALHSSSQDPNNVETWPLKSFTRQEIFPHIEHFDYVIHGDWNKHFYRGYWTKKNGEFHVMAVGNKRKGDSLFITRLDVFPDTVISTPITIDIPNASKWYK